MKTQKPYNTLLYFGFVLFGIYYLCLKEEFIESTIYLGIALLFDPFNQDQIWKDKPVWQRTILALQALLVIGVVIYTVLKKLA